LARWMAMAGGSAQRTTVPPAVVPRPIGNDASGQIFEVGDNRPTWPGGYQRVTVPRSFFVKLSGASGTTEAACMDKRDQGYTQNRGRN